MNRGFSQLADYLRTTTADWTRTYWLGMTKTSDGAFENLDNTLVGYTLFQVWLAMLSVDQYRIVDESEQDRTSTERDTNGPNRHFGRGPVRRHYRIEPQEK